MIACAICHDLAESVERIEIVGGLRRQQERVRGISIIYISKVEAEVRHDHQGDLFGGYKKHVGKNVYAVEVALKQIPYLDYRVDEDGDLITTVKHPFRFKAMHFKRPKYREQGIPIDLFPVQTSGEWGVALTMKTGPAKFTMRMTTAARRKGLNCNGHRLLKFKDNSWVPASTEEEFFQLCGMRYVAPQDRR